MEEYEGIISKIIFYNPENKYIVAVFETDDEQFTITGNMSYVNNDDRYRIKGSYVIHPRYGKQFKVSSYEIILADDRSEIIRYLSSPLFKGVGKKMAERIVEALGNQALTMIKEDPDCLDTISHMNEKIKNNIIGVLNSQDYDQQVLSFFMGYGISTRNLTLIQNFYKEKTLDVLQNDPYRLIDDIEGIGFKSVDELAMKIGIEALDEKRIKAAICASLMDLCFQTGSTYSDYETFYRVFRRMLPECPDDLFTKMLDEILGDKVIQEEDRFYPYELYQGEKTIVEKFNRYMDLENKEIDETSIDEKIKEAERSQGITYDDIQKDAIKKFLDVPALILTGGPGTGKTTIVQAILKVYKSLFPDEKIGLVAPTGRAAKRLSELTHLEASTIHRLLKWDISTNTFSMNEKHPLDIDLLVIDEFSMVDTLLFSKLLEAGTHIHKILLIGDEQQLPSVSPGNVLKDMLESNVPHICLQTIYRQVEGSGIVALSHDIRNDQYDPHVFDDYHDIHFTVCPNVDIAHCVTIIVRKAVEEGYDASDVQVLAPMYRGVAGIDALNESLQAIFNPPSLDKAEIRVGGKIFREGDKLLQLRNRPDDDVYNGDVGILVEIENKEDTGLPYDTLTVDFDGQFVNYRANEFNMLRHAYCMSVHKSQGNEFKIVIMTVLPEYSIMMKKNLLYTGITRAKQSLFILGDHGVFVRGLHNNQDELRKTTLQERFKERNVTPSFSISDFE